MEFRWLTPEEKRTPVVAQTSLAEVLALAQQLQAEGESLVGEEQVVEMGRELGVQPEYVREALRLRRRAVEPATVLADEANATPPAPNLIAVTANVLMNLCALLLLPVVLYKFQYWRLDYSWIFFAGLAAAITGWTARAPRLAALAGVVSVPAILFVSYCYSMVVGSPHIWLSKSSLFLTLLTLCPLGATTGRAAARLRDWAERLVSRERLTAPIR
jgi:hypothetical protein